MFDKSLQAYTRTTAPFTQPAIGASVVVDVESCVFAPVGMPVFVEGGGEYTVADKQRDTALTLKNSGSTGNAAPGVAVATNKLLSPCRGLGRPQFDMLWVCQLNIDTKLYGFTAAQAASAPSSAPAVTLTLPALGPADGNTHTVNALGFAPNGDMWVGYNTASGTGVGGSGQYLAKISASKLLATASITPDFSFPLPVATGEYRSGISAILITPAGDLWATTIASDVRSSGLFFYTAASIASPGSPTPSVVLSQVFPPVPDNPLHTNAANDIWFDSATGSLWFTNATAGTVNKLSASQLLTSSSSIVPAVILAIGAYSGVAIDGARNLWCAGAPDNIDMFGSVDTLVSGAPAPVRRISTSGSTARRARFDRAGTLWSLALSGPLGRPPADIAASGSPPPRCALTGAGALTAARVLNFNPQGFA